MKIQTLAMFSLASVNIYAAMTADGESALRNGALGRYVYRVVDDGGIPVSNASAHVWFRSYGRPQDKADWVVQTDTNGMFAAEHSFNEQFSVGIDKEGYYHTHVEINYLSMTELPVKDGKWQPYGETRTVVLKQIRQPQDMLGVDCPPQRKIRIYDEWLGVDLAKGDFVPPVGNGCEPDMLVRFHLAGEMPYDWSIRMDVSFTNSPYAGAYRLKMDNWSDMKSVYQADTNATYLSELSFRYAREKGKRTPNMEKLGKDEYLVFRTRTKVDGGGKLLSARYGKLYGPWHFEDGGGFRIHKVFLNRNDNDVNLEDTWTIENAKKYRSHLR